MTGHRRERRPARVARDPPERPTRAGVAGTTGGGGRDGRRGHGGGGKERRRGQSTGTAGVGGAWRCPDRHVHAADAHRPHAAAAGRTFRPTETFAPGFSIIEGPVWIGDALYVSQFGSASRPPTSRLMKVVPGAAGVVLNADFGSNGLAVDERGDIIAAVHKDGSIRRLSLANPSTSTVVAAQYQGKRFNSPNDVAVRSDGTVYFSDPDAFQAPQPVPQTKPRVYGVSPAGVVSVVDETIGEPNGVTLSLDETTLFVDGDAGLFKFAVMPDGSVGPKTPFGTGMYTGSDGMVMDCAGDLYVVDGGNVVVLDPTGAELGRIAVTGVQSASNVAFGGADHETLVHHDPRRQPRRVRGRDGRPRHAVLIASRFPNRAASAV